MRLNQLPKHIERCDAVVAAFPEDPGPRNDRYLLHSLTGNDTAACDDLREAVKLAARMPKQQLDPQLRSDLAVRQQLCRGKGTGQSPAR